MEIRVVKYVQPMSDDPTQGKKARFSDITLAGLRHGEVKRLEGFDKSRHIPPKYVNDRARLFLARICSRELKEWAEGLFSELRLAMEYKRKDLSVDLGDGIASIISKDFELVRQYSLIDDSPEVYCQNTELRFLGGPELAEIETFNQAIGSLFDRMRCSLVGAVQIEAMIDVIEAKPSSGIIVDYPSTYLHCDCRIQGIDAFFRFDPHTLEIRFDSFCAPYQIVDALQQMNDLFSNDDVLGQLLA